MSSVLSIHLATGAGEDLGETTRVKAVAGKGLEGDRYFDGTGSFSKKPGSGRQVTLIEMEAIEALESESGVKIAPAEARRNIVTRGVALNHLVGRDFKIGECRMRGIRLCEPCSYLAGLTSEKVRVGLIHRGGLRADIVEGGIIRAGDAVEAV